jgi:hypothetical protein
MRKHFRNTDLGLFVCYVTAKPVKITTRKCKSSQLVKTEDGKDKVQGTGKMEINGNILKLRAT